MRHHLCLAIVLLTGCTEKPKPPPSRTALTAPAEPSDEAREPQPAASTAHLGTAHPVLLQVHSPTGSWAVLCQARSDTDGDGTIAVHLGHHGDTYGDRMTPYLILGGGPGMPIDAFVSASENGRWLMFVRSGELVLLDTERDVETVLEGADTEDDAGPLRAHPAASFDAAGTRVVYVRNRPEGTAVVLRELASGRETVVEAGSGVLLRAWLDPGGDVVFSEVITKDTNGDGKLRPRAVRTSLADRGCRGPVTSYSTFGQDGDEVELRSARARSGAALTTIPGTIGAWGSAIIVRRNDGAIEARHDHETVELFDAACKANIEHLARDAGRLYASCSDKRLLLHDGERATDSGWRVERTGGDRFGGRPMIELEDGMVLSTTHGVTARAFDFAVEGFGFHMTAHQLDVTDLATGKHRQIVLAMSRRAYPVAATPPFLAFDDQGTTTIIDFVGARPPATLSRTVHALTTSGAVLVDARRPGSVYRSRDVPMGPLEWIDPFAQP